MLILAIATSFYGLAIPLVKKFSIGLYTQFIVKKKLQV